MTVVAEVVAEVVAAAAALVEITLEAVVAAAVVVTKVVIAILGKIFHLYSCFSFSLSDGVNRNSNKKFKSRVYK